jgi:hypothetical protein
VVEVGMESMFIWVPSPVSKQAEVPRKGSLCSQTRQFCGEV